MLVSIPQSEYVSAAYMSVILKTEVAEIIINYYWMIDFDFLYICVYV